MYIVLLILQGLLSAIFAMAVFMKISKSKEELMKQASMAWTSDVSAGGIKAIGMLELLAAIGLVLPPLLNTLPWLSPLAALGLVCTMIGALILHMRRGDGKQALTTNVILLLLAAFVAYGRLMLIPF